MVVLSQSDESKKVEAENFHRETITAADFQIKGRINFVIWKVKNKSAQSKEVTHVTAEKCEIMSFSEY